MGLIEELAEAGSQLLYGLYEEEPPTMFDGSYYERRVQLLHNGGPELLGGNYPIYLKIPKRRFAERDFAYRKTKKEFEKTIGGLDAYPSSVKITEMYLARPGAIEPDLDARIVLELVGTSGKNNILLLRPSGSESPWDPLEYLASYNIEATEHDTKLLAYRLKDYFEKNGAAVSVGKEIDLGIKNRKETPQIERKGDKWWMEQYMAQLPASF